MFNGHDLDTRSKCSIIGAIKIWSKCTVDS